MAKKKVPKPEKPKAAQEDLSEKMASLKTLNNLLVRETVERREQIDMLHRAKHSLQSKIAHSLADNQRLEAEKSLFEDRFLAADLDRDISILVFSLQVRHKLSSEMTQKMESMEKDKEELIARIAVLEEIELRELQEEANRLVCEMGLVRRDLDAKGEEADGLRSMVRELEVRNEESAEEIGLLRMKCIQVSNEKMEVERSFGSTREERDLIQKSLHELMERCEDLRREMGYAINERNEMERARNEMGVEITRLQEEVALLNAEISSNRGALEHVLLERDALQNDLGLQKAEEKRNTESLMAEKASLERRLIESSGLIEGLKRKMEEMLINKDKIEAASAEKEIAITKLQNEVSRLGATISTLRGSLEDLEETNGQLLDDLGNQKAALECVCGERDAAQKHTAQLKEDKTLLQSRVFEVETENRELQVELKRVTEELDGLVEGIKKKEKRLESLRGEKTKLTVRVDDVMRKMKVIMEEKGEIEQVKIEQENQIKQLQKEVSWLNTTASALRESCRDRKEQNNQLQADKNKILREKDVNGTELDHQRVETDGLRSRIREMEKSLEKKQQELLQLRTEKDNLVEEMKERERCFELLMKAKDLIEGSLVESQQSLKDQQVKAELATMVSHQTLSMLKHVAETMSGLEDEGKGPKTENGIDGGRLNDEIQPFVTELEAVKKAYQSRLQEVEDMSKELKSLQMSAAKSKKWSLLTWLSSATTIFAAICVAYVAKGQ